MDDSDETPTFVGCPECGAPAEVTDRFVLESTDGPIEMVKVRCISRRWFTVLVSELARTGARPQEGCRDGRPV